MIKKTISYENYDNVTCVDTFYFNLTKSELRELEWSVPGGLVAQLNKMTENPDENVAAMMRVLKTLILAAYGEKSDDGKRFIKSRDGINLADEFADSAAFEVLFDELLSNENSINEFVTGILPKTNVTMPVGLN